MTLNFLDKMNKKQALFVAFLWAIALVGLFLITSYTRNNLFLFSLLIVILAVALTFTAIVTVILLIFVIVLV
jgi:hypothetical protein